MREIEKFQNGDIVKNVQWPEFGLGPRTRSRPGDAGRLRRRVRERDLRSARWWWSGQAGLLLVLHLWQTLNWSSVPASWFPARPSSRSRAGVAGCTSSIPAPSGRSSVCTASAWSWSTPLASKQSVHPEDLEIIQVTPAPAKEASHLRPQQPVRPHPRAPAGW